MAKLNVVAINKRTDDSDISAPIKLAAVDIPENDQYLWLQFREGNKDAYTLLLKKFANILFSYGHRYSKDEDFVKDCIQDVFFELWNRRENIKQTPCVKAYLFKSLRLRIFREQPKWRNTEFLEDSHLFEDWFNIEAHLIHEQNSKEIKAKLQIVLAGLSQRQKEILYLRFYEDIDHDHIGRIMGLSRQSVYNLLYRSIIGLRKNAELINFF